MSEKIYFSIAPKYAGFSDQLLQFSALYKLGLSLGYTYWHQPFLSPRSSGSKLPARLENRFYRWSRVIPYWHKFLSLLETFNIYEFIGFDDFFLEKNKREDMSRAKKSTLIFSDDLNRDQKFKTLADLQDYVTQFMTRNSEPGQKKWLNFEIEGPWAGWQLILKEIPQYPDGLDLRKIYFQKRASDHWPEVYPTGRVKSMIHIRQGDTAVIPTPWDTFITLWPARFAFQEYGQFDDLPLSQRMILVEDYAFFYKELKARMADSMATLVFSDGFERALQKLNRHMDQFNFSKQQEEALRQSVEMFDETQFQSFDGIDNSRLFVGEDAEKLCHMVHSFMTADVLIIGSQQWMFPKLVALYYHFENMPLVIVLRKSDEETVWQYDGLNLGERLKKFIFVNIHQADFTTIVESIGNHLAEKEIFNIPDENF